MFCQRYLVLLSMIGILTLIGCSKKGITEPEKTVEEMTSEGWDIFETYDYQQALKKFDQAILKDSSYTDAFNGSGWANAKLTHLSIAVSRFVDCLNLDSLQLDAKAGLAFVYNAQKEYCLSIQMSNETLNLNPNWTFLHDVALSSSDLHLLLAESYFALSNFSASLSEVQVLNPSFSADVSTPEGRSALAVEIERLKGLV